MHGYGAKKKKLKVETKLPRWSVMEAKSFIGPNGDYMT